MTTAKQCCNASMRTVVAIIVRCCWYWCEL